MRGLFFIDKRRPLYNTLFFACLFSVFTHCQAKAQKGTASVLLEWSGSSNVKSHSSGKSELEFLNWRLEDILKSIDPLLIFRVDSEKLKTSSLNLKYIGNLDNPEYTIENINAALKLEDILILKSKDIPDVFKLSYSGESGCKESPYIDKVTSINRVWKGKCIHLSKIGEKIRDWFGLNVEVEDDILIPEVSLHHDEFEVFKIYLSQKGFSLKLDRSSSRTSYIYKQ